MKVLSIDVGIKNLAICIIHFNEKDDINKYKFFIEKLEIINLIEDNKFNCQFQSENNKKIICCNKQAKFVKNNCYYCKSHASNNTNFILPTSQLQKIKRLKLDELIDICQDYDISYCKKSKIYLLETLDKFIKDKVFENIGEVKCNEISLIDISKAIKCKLDNFLLNINDIDYVLIENQISPIANRMNCIQGMLTQYFINKNICNIHYISSINKLKEFIGNDKLNYNERKKKSIIITKDILNQIDMAIDNKENIINNFLKSKKQDDLADCFLQCLWFIKNFKR